MPCRDKSVLQIDEDDGNVIDDVADERTMLGNSDRDLRLA